MRNPIYIRQLKRDLDEWVERGLVHPDDVNSFLESAGTGGKKKSLQTLFAILGAILLGFAAISYVAANFGAIPRIVLLSSLIVLMIASYSTGTAALIKAKDGLGQALILLGTILFGVNIMLIAQMYHISSHYPNGVLVWGLGALAIAIVTPSRPALGLAFILGAIWTTLESVEFDVMFHWPFLAYWAVASITAHFMGWRLGFHLSLLSLLYWIVLNTSDLADALGWSEIDILSLYTMGFLVMWAKGVYAASFEYTYGQTIARYGILLFLASFFVFQIAADDMRSETMSGLVMGITYGLGALAILAATLTWRRDVYNLLDIFAHLGFVACIVIFPHLDVLGEITVRWLYSAFYLIACIWFLSLGARYNETFIINTALVAFGVQTIYLYFRTFDTLLSQSAFFAVGGAVLVGLSILLERLRRRITDREEDEDEIEDIPEDYPTDLSDEAEVTS